MAAFARVLGMIVGALLTLIGGGCSVMILSAYFNNPRRPASDLSLMAMSLAALVVGIALIVWLSRGLNRTGTVASTDRRRRRDGSQGDA
jgi:uncharacterized membrane-anchored protein